MEWKGMAMLNKLRLRLQALFFKSRLEEELDEEVRFHLDREVQENIARGMGPEEARYAAIRSFGGVERVKEESRDVRGVRLVEELWQDLRYGARMLRKSPGFTVMATLTLALGIGVNTTIFTLMNLYLRPLPVKDPETIVELVNYRASFPEYVHFRDHTQTFSGLTASFTALLILGDQTASNEPQEISGQYVSDNYFSVLGVNPELGRVFAPEETNAPGKSPLAVLSHAIWQSRFGGDPNILGRTVRLNNVIYEVIGVMPPDFIGF